MNLGQIRWYRHRLAAMTPSEMAWRLHDEVRHVAWMRHQVPLGSPPTAPRRVGPGFTTPLPTGSLEAVPAQAAAALVEEADQLLHGSGQILGVPRTDLAAPDWFADPLTGRPLARGRYAFRTDHRSRAESGDVKLVLELSRLQHLTILAGAWAFTGDDHYADAVDRQLRSWWEENRLLSGVHWTSGIELALRLISWVWIRRLLEGWAGAPALFEDNPEAARQLYWHQRYLSVFRSRGTSANNHVVAEATGQLVASTAFPWFAESERWRTLAVDLFERELMNNTFPDGLDREQATDYHGFVAELGLVGAAESAAARAPVSAGVWNRLCAMVDGVAAFVDCAGRAPRQGDSDDGRALIIDPSTESRWNVLLALGSSLFGAASWWPATTPGVTSTLVATLGGSHPPTAARPQRRPSHFPDAGLTLLRTPPGDDPEIWCRCRGGPQGFLAIAGHAHADALSLELRHGGIDILADPGTYCYHGQSEWRRYFRSTLAHNTVEIGGRDQSSSGGPFLWLDHATSTTIDAEVDEDDATACWSARHDGYTVLDPPVIHHRTVVLDRQQRCVDVVDRLETGIARRMVMAWHLGPTVSAELDGPSARLRWPTAAGVGSAVVGLPDGLHWSVHRGEIDPPLGWYSARFGDKQPTVTLLGQDSCGPARREYRTGIQFSP